MHELEKIKKHEPKKDKRKIVYKGYKTRYDFTKFKAIRTFQDAIKNGVVTMDMENNEPNQLTNKTREFTSITRSRSKWQ